MIVLEELTEQIISAGIEVHRALGPGLLESAYEMTLLHELALRGLAVRRQVQLPVIYKAVRLDSGYRMDLVVEDKVLVEVKSVEAMNKINEAQLMTCLRPSGMGVGLIINFNVTLLKDGIIRRVI